MEWDTVKINVTHILRDVLTTFFKSLFIRCLCKVQLFRNLFHWTFVDFARTFQFQKKKISKLYYFLWCYTNTTTQIKYCCFINWFFDMYLKLIFPDAGDLRRKEIHVRVFILYKWSLSYAGHIIIKILAIPANNFYDFLLSTQILLQAGLHVLNVLSWSSCMYFFFCKISLKKSVAYQ